MTLMFNFQTTQNNLCNFLSNSTLHLLSQGKLVQYKYLYKISEQLRKYRVSKLM